MPNTSFTESEKHFFSEKALETIPEELRKRLVRLATQKATKPRGLTSIGLINQAVDHPNFPQDPTEQSKLLNNLGSSERKTRKAAWASLANPQPGIRLATSNGEKVDAKPTIPEKGTKTLTAAPDLVVAEPETGSGRPARRRTKADKAAAG